MTATDDLFTRLIGHAIDEEAKLGSGAWAVSPELGSDLREAAAELTRLQGRIAALERERDALRTRVNRLIGLCKSYSGALIDSDYPPTQRDKLDALIGDIEP